MKKFFKSVSSITAENWKFYTLTPIMKKHQITKNHNRSRYTFIISLRNLVIPYLMLTVDTPPPIYGRWSVPKF